MYLDGEINQLLRDKQAKESDFIFQFFLQPMMDHVSSFKSNFKTLDDMERLKYLDYFISIMSLLVKITSQVTFFKLFLLALFFWLYLILSKEQTGRFIAIFLTYWNPENSADKQFHFLNLIQEISHRFPEKTHQRKFYGLLLHLEQS